MFRSLCVAMFCAYVSAACSGDGDRALVRGAAAKIVEGAKRQAREGASYTVGYFQIGYPGGDLPRSQGVCTDVVIRALRSAGYDLQKLIHEDMARRFKTYPRREKKPDPNIDHRRCPNQAWFFRSYGRTLTLVASPKTAKEWKPGDIVYWKLDSGLDHTGVLSDRLNPSGLPYVVHNLGTCAEEDVLTSWKIVGHYRFPKEAALPDNIVFAYLQEMLECEAPATRPENKRWTCQS